MRIALLSDIHGNPVALDAVLKDIEERGGVDGYWVLGDLCVIGHDPSGVIERLNALPNAVFIRGNGDRYISTGTRPPPSVEAVLENPALLPILTEVAGSFAWTEGHLAARGWLGWLERLPLEQRLTLPDGTRVLLVHAAPGTDDGVGLNPALGDDEINAVLAGCEADLICVGHFHMPMDRRMKTAHIINPGSISNAFPPDLRASYALLAADENGYNVTFHRAEYDLQAVIAATRRVRHPGGDFIIRFLEGQIRAGWLNRWDGVRYAVEETV